MRRRSRLLRVAKWGGVALCGLLLLLWLTSTAWLIEYLWSSGTSMYGGFICRGAIGVHADVEPEVYWSGEWAIQDGYHRPELLREIAANPWAMERLDSGVRMIRWPGAWRGCRSGAVSCLSGTDRFVPFWIPLLVTVVPTACSGCVTDRPSPATAPAATTCAAT